jgi:ribonuclease HII
MGNQTFKYVAGVDEAGRGPLCGPVVAACAGFKVFDRELFCAVGDSKALSALRRERLYARIQTASWYGLGIVDAQTIDRINIFQATQLAFRKAIERFLLVSGLDPTEVLFLIDGNQFRHPQYHHRCIVKGDAKVPLIGAASILAKVRRDRIMARYDKVLPQWEFTRHKGYGTPRHRELIRQHGPSPIHRKSFTLLPAGEEQLKLD